MLSAWLPAMSSKLRTQCRTCPAREQPGASAGAKAGQRGRRARSALISATGSWPWARVARTVQPDSGARSWNWGNNAYCPPSADLNWPYAELIAAAGTSAAPARPPPPATLPSRTEIIAAKLVARMMARLCTIAIETKLEGVLVGPLIDKRPSCHAAGPGGRQDPRRARSRWRARDQGRAGRWCLRAPANVEISPQAEIIQQEPLRDFYASDTRDRRSDAHCKTGVAGLLRRFHDRRSRR